MIRIFLIIYGAVFSKLILEANKISSIDIKRIIKFFLFKKKPTKPNVKIVDDKYKKYVIGISKIIIKNYFLKI